MDKSKDDPRIAAATKQIISYIHPLRYLFLELTRKCNLRCAHCGSACPEYNTNAELTASDFKHVIDRIAQAYSPSQIMFCITGGEPLMNNDWYEICSYISAKGYSWGMTTNGTLIDEKCIRDMYLAGMKTVSVSLDGLQDSHEKLRGVVGSFDRAVNGIRLLKDSGRFKAVQVVTVVSKLNINELPELYDFICSLGVDSWKLTAIEPMGDAIAQRSLFLDEHENYSLLNFILLHKKRAPFEITYGCSHFLPKRYDNTVRRQSFLCGAGTLIASVASNGDILPCLDIDCREAVKQGNILCDDIVEVWENRFAIFRKNKALSSDVCRQCQYRQECQGDSWHSWNFKENVPRICFKKHIFF